MPISSLSQEILTRIFEIFCSDSQNRSLRPSVCGPSYPRVVLPVEKLMSVSQHWRQVASESVNCWTKIEEDGTGNLWRLLDHLKYSKQANISVTLNYHSGGNECNFPNPAFSAILKEMHRVRELRIISRQSMFSDILAPSFLGHEASILRSLSLSRYLIDAPLFDEPIPSLRSLTFDFCILTAFFLPSGAPLTKLAIFGSEAWHTVPVDVLLDALRTLPSLKRLRLSPGIKLPTVGSRTGVSMRKVHCPALFDVKIDIMEGDGTSLGETVLYFFERIRMHNEATVDCSFRCLTSSQDFEPIPDVFQAMMGAHSTGRALRRFQIMGGSTGNYELSEEIEMHAYFERPSDEPIETTYLPWSEDASKNPPRSPIPTTRFSFTFSANHLESFFATLSVCKDYHHQLDQLYAVDCHVAGLSYPPVSALGTIFGPLPSIRRLSFELPECDYNTEGLFELLCPADKWEVVPAGSVSKVTFLPQEDDPHSPPSAGDFWYPRLESFALYYVHEDRLDDESESFYQYLHGSFAGYLRRRRRYGPGLKQLVFRKPVLVTASSRVLAEFVDEFVEEKVSQEVVMEV